VLLPKILDKQDNAWQWWKSIVSPIILINRAYLILIKTICRLLYIFNQLFLNFLRHFFYHSQFAGFRFFIITVSSRLTATIHNLQHRYHATLLIRIISIKHFLAIGLLFIFLSSLFILSVFVSTLPQFEYDEKREYSDMSVSFVNDDKKWLLYSDKSIDLFINDREKWLLKDMRECGHEHEVNEYNLIQAIFNICKIQINNDVKRNSLLLTAVLHEKIADNDHVGLFLFRNLDLSEKIITADEHLSHELENTLDKSSTLEKIAGINLNNRDLRYANFNNTELPKADLRSANLQGANLINAKLHNTSLKGANLIDARLNGAELHNTHLEEAKLYGANLNGAELYDTHLEGAELQGADLSSARLKDAEFDDAKLQGVNLQTANFLNIDLDCSELQGANLDNAKLRYTDLKYAQLQGANLILDEYSNSNEKLRTANTVSTDCKKKANIYCLTNDKNLPICKKYDKTDTQTLKKVTNYWINDLACSDKWIARGIIRNYLDDDKFKTYLTPLLNKKLSDKTCLGIQNLPDEIKQQIILENKPTNKN
jgi:uncharacterized protein YjbI with pentapeptide repeats/uncharacterized membrane protein YqhA